MNSLTKEKAAIWVDKHFPDAKSRRDDNERVINNPFDGDTGYHFNISLDRFACNDWRGNHWQGHDKDGKTYKCTFLHFVRLYLGCTYRDAVKSVMGESSRYFLPRRAVEEVHQLEHEIELPKGSVRLIDSPYPKQAALLFRWLASRGVDKTDVGRYDLHHLGSEVIWPYYEYEILVYWQSRSRLNKRFCFPTLVEGGKGKGDFLYGFDDVEPASSLVLTEAIFDKLTLRTQTVATGGAVLTKSQLGLIKDLGPRDGIVLAPDNDKAGVESVLSNGRMLIDRGHKVFYSLPPEMEYEVDGDKRTTKDWNELLSVMSAKEIPQVMENGIRPLNTATLVKLQMRALKTR